MTYSTPLHSQSSARSFLKRRFLRAVVLGVLIVGVGCMIWALLQMAIQSDQLSRSTQAASSADALTFQQSVSDSQNDSLRGTAFYSSYPQEGDIIGTLSLPALDQVIPIIEGTGDEELQRGVGHYTQSLLPGEQDNCVLSGHRDTVFSDLGKLQIHDRLITETSAGVYTYEVRDIRIVSSDDRTVIVPTDHAVLTLTTCYPFDFIGNAPDRYIVSADLVKSA